MNCTTYTAPVSTGCGRILFDPTFRDWALSEACGSPVYLIGFGNAATTAFPSMTTCPAVIMHPNFADFKLLRDSCGVATTMIGFNWDGVPNSQTAFCDLIGGMTDGGGAA